MLKKCVGVMRESKFTDVNKIEFNIINIIIKTNIYFSTNLSAIVVFKINIKNI